MRLRAIGTILFAASASASASAAPVATPDVVSMTSAADVIIVGREAAPLGEDASLRERATVNIVPTRVLKGTLAPRSIAVVSTDISPDSPRGIRYGDFGIFFLRATRSGTYHFVDRYIISVNAYPGGDPDVANDATPLARVATELAYVFTVPASVAGDPATGLSGPTWPSSPSFPGQNIFAATYMSFYGISAEVALPALNKVIPIAPFPGNAWASAVALSLGDTARLKTLMQLMMGPGHRGMLLENFLVQALISAKFSVSDISLLGQLLSSKNHYVREAAFQSLERMESPASVPVLETSIESPDPDIGRRVVGLICFEIHSCGAPAQWAHYAMPINHSELRELIRVWERAHLGP